MTDDTVNATLVPLAAELVATIRDYGPDDVAAVLARVPDGRHDALAVVLAAMVDPDARVSELLAWTTAGPVKSRDIAPPTPRPRRATGRTPYEREHGTDRGYYQHRTRHDWPACDACLDAHSDATYKAQGKRRTKRRKAS